MSDDNEQLTVDDIIGEAAEAKYHTILEIWSSVIGKDSRDANTRITPQWASRIINTYTGIDYPDMVRFRELFYERVAELANILSIEIETDDECLKRTSAEEDATENLSHYINIITLWQKAALLWELEWDCTDPDAAVEVAVISEIHKMFLEQNGLVSLLDQIKIEFTDEDRENLATELEEFRQAVEG